ncbi:hypothetical protein ACG97_11955 [Vogesella sp. EB]|nr:hypothetical protein ACG97_11955 [Vogesella sp. EB]
MHQCPFCQSSRTCDINNFLFIVQVTARSLRYVMQVSLLHHIQQTRFKGKKTALIIDDRGGHQR